MSWDTPSAFGQQTAFPIGVQPPSLQFNNQQTKASGDLELEAAYHLLNDTINTLTRSKGLSRNQIDDLIYDLQEISQLVYKNLP